MMRTPLPILSTLLLPALLAVACGASDGDDGGEVATDATADAGGDPTAPAGASPGGLPGDVFLQIELVGGFVPAGFDLRTVPSVTVYADGTVLVPGASIASYPGPAVMPLSTGTLDQQQLDELLAEVGAAGLLAEVPPDPGENPMVADAATTRITVVVNGRDSVLEAYALDIPLDPSVPGFDDQQGEVRELLSALLDSLTEAATLAAVEIYEPVGYRVMATEPFETDPSVAPNQLTWPTDLPLPELDECVAITGPGAATFTTLLADATEITRWTVGDDEVTLHIRPMLPHEVGC